MGGMAVAVGVEVCVAVGNVPVTVGVGGGGHGPYVISSCGRLAMVPFSRDAKRNSLPLPSLASFTIQP